MQKDMHYDANYVLARLAGLPQDLAQTIANAGQFVDDNNCKESLLKPVQDSVLELADGSFIRRVATAHHPAQVSENIDYENQVQVWVPFHFYPGGQGTTIQQKLICVTDSDNINEAIKNHLGLAFRSFSPHLMGITAHVYGDTFSHYGFCGISHQINEIGFDEITIDNEDYIRANWTSDKNKDAMDYIKGKYGTAIAKAREKGKRIAQGRLGRMVKGVSSMFGDPASLGHAFAATYPDRPYMEWTINWSQPNERVPELMLDKRDNPQTFLRGAEKLHEMFMRYAAELKQADANGKLVGWGNKAPATASFPQARSFAEVKDKIDEVLRAPGDKEFRCQKWNEFSQEVLREPIPAYEGDTWNNSWEDLAGAEEPKDAKDLHGVDIWQFYRAASVHRNFTLRVLLPDQDIVLR